MGCYQWDHYNISLKRFIIAVPANRSTCSWGKENWIVLKDFNISASLNDPETSFLLIGGQVSHVNQINCLLTELIAKEQY